MTDIERLQKIIDESDNIVFFGGAGVSTESGIPDFRSTDGLYNMKYDYPPETILSHEFFFQKTEEFYRFYRDKIYCPSALPNAAHLALSRLEREGKLSARKAGEELDVCHKTFLKWVNTTKEGAVGE